MLKKKYIYYNRLKQKAIQTITKNANRFQLDREKKRRAPVIKC